jgi:hypothetical protein
VEGGGGGGEAACVPRPVSEEGTVPSSKCCSRSQVCSGGAMLTRASAADRLCSRGQAKGTSTRS